LTKKLGIGDLITKQNRSKRHGELVKAIRQIFDYRHIPHMGVTNYRCFKCGQVQNTGAKDWPDVFGYAPLIAVEAKTGQAVLTPGQKVVKKHLESQGVPYIVCRDTTDALLEHLKEKK